MTLGTKFAVGFRAENKSGFLAIVGCAYDTGWIVIEKLNNLPVILDILRYSYHEICIKTYLTFFFGTAIPLLAAAEQGLTQMSVVKHRLTKHSLKIEWDIYMLATHTQQ